MYYYKLTTHIVIVNLISLLSYRRSVHGLFIFRVCIMCLRPRSLHNIMCVCVHYVTDNVCVCVYVYYFVSFCSIRRTHRMYLFRTHAKQKIKIRSSSRGPFARNEYNNFWMHLKKKKSLCAAAASRSLLYFA